MKKYFHHHKKIPLSPFVVNPSGKSQPLPTTDLICIPTYIYIWFLSLPFPEYQIDEIIQWVAEKVGF